VFPGKDEREVIGIAGRSKGGDKEMVWVQDDSEGGVKAAGSMSRYGKRRKICMPTILAKSSGAASWP